MKTNNGDLPAMPSGTMQDGMYAVTYPLNSWLSKREMFAMAAMQWLLAHGADRQPRYIVQDAVIAADALLAELEKAK